MDLENIITLVLSGLSLILHLAHHIANCPAVMDSETMGDRNVHCLSLIGYYRCESIEVCIGQKNLAPNFGGIFGAIFNANNERSKSTSF